MHTLKHIAGSYAVLVLGMHCYIDARKDVRDDLSHLEVVRGGQVILRDSIPNAQAPERIMELARRFV